MNEILKEYLSVSLSASFLIVLLMIFRPLYQRRFSRRWQYYIWLIVIVRLVLPWNPGNGIVGHFFQEKRIETWMGKILEADKEAELENAKAEIEAQKLSSQNGRKESSSTQENGQENIRKENAVLNQTVNGSFTESSMESNMKIIHDSFVWHQKVQMLLQNIWVLWLSVAFTLLIRKIIIYQSFARFLKAGCTAVEDIERLEALGKMMEQGHIRRMTGLYTNSLIASPLLIGFIYPNIVLTKAQLSDTDFHYTILHELTHYKRRDMFYKWLVQFVVCLHWFNPFVYWMVREISRNCELSCDEAVIKNLDADGRREYGDTLLRAMGAGGVYHNTLASMTLNESRELLKERLGAIMNDKKKTRLTAVLSAVAALILTGSAVAAGAYMQPAAAEIREDGIQLSDCKMIQKEGVFYILCEDVDEEDMPSGVNINRTSVSLKKGKSITLKLIGSKEQALWSSANKKIAVVNKNGKVTAKKVGSTKILAKLGSWTYVCRVKVTDTADNNKDLAKVEAADNKENIKQEVKDKIKDLAKVEAKDKIKDQVKAKVEAAAAEIYQALGITERNGAYYYQGKRIRIFMDIRPDDSFVKFSYDKKGTIDIKLRRKKDFSIAGVEYLTKSEAKEILQDMDESESDSELEAVKPEVSIARLEKNDLPDEVNKAVGKCETGTWYVIGHREYQYIYYQGLPNDYAFQPVLSEKQADIKIVDMKRSGRYDVLLAVKKNVALSIYYHDRKIKYQKVSV